MSEQRDTPLIELRDVAKSYREGDRNRTILAGVDLVVHRGETVAITGRSGTGKSTLLNLVSGIDTPDRGDVFLNGRSLGGLDDRARTLLRRRDVGFVFQFFNLIPTLTVEENVRLPLDLARTGQREAAGRVRRLLASVGLEGRAGSYPDRLSGGEQQRVAIVRALAHDPALVLADEPTGNLDAATGREILDILAAAGDGSRTLVVVTHSPEVVGMAGRVLEIRDGRLREAHHEPAGTAAG